MIDKIRKAVDYIQSISDIEPELGLVLGTGLNELAGCVSEREEISYGDIPGFGVSSAPSHAGKLILGRIGDKSVAVMQGRLHHYEGFSLEEVTFPMRVLAGLGISTVLITNAAGSLNPYLLPGEPVLIKDHLNLMGSNPLIGKNEPELGVRFPSLHDTYTRELRNQIKEIGRLEGKEYQEGVYAAVTGPSFETRAECLMLRGLGADLVGMSTVPEVIVAKHQGLDVIGLSVVTNLSNIFHDQTHDQGKIQRNAAKSQKRIERIIKEIKLKV